MTRNIGTESAVLVAQCILGSFDVDRSSHPSLAARDNPQQQQHYDRIPIKFLEASRASSINQPARKPTTRPSNPPALPTSKWEAAAIQNRTLDGRYFVSLEVKRACLARRPFSSWSNSSSIFSGKAREVFNLEPGSRGREIGRAGPQTPRGSPGKQASNQPTDQVSRQAGSQLGGGGGGRNEKAAKTPGGGGELNRERQLGTWTAWLDLVEERR